MIHLLQKLVTSIAILFAVLAANSNVAVSQEPFIGENQAVNRVIKLQPKTQQTATPKVASREINQAEQIARQAKPAAGPPKIEYDVIKVPDALKNSPGPAAEPKPTQTVENPEPAAIAPAAIAPAVSSNWETAAPVAATPTPKAEAEEEQVAVQKRSSLLAMEIHSPKFVNVNQPALFVIKIRNQGMESVENVKLVARIPTHTQLASASQAQTHSEGRGHEFVITSIEAKGTHEVSLELVPTEKKPVEIATFVIVENAQRTSVAVRQPVLSLVLNGPRQTNIGQNVTHELVVTNEGDGIATDVHLKALFPEQLKTQDQSSDPVIPIIEPGNSVSVTYQSQALAPGPVQLKVDAKAAGAEPKQVAMDFRIFQPELRVSAAGPKLNYVARDGIYTISIDNTGEADITDVEVSLVVPGGMKVTTISREAAVDAEKGTLTWGFPKLSSNSTERIQLKATAVSAGVQVCNIQVSSNETPDKEIKLVTQVVTRADLSVRIKNLTGPVQVGGKAEFLVEVENQGSRKANEVNVHIALPESLMPIDKNRVSVDQAENGIAFVQPEVAPGQKVSFKFTAVGVVEGEHVVRSILEAADSQRQLVSEDVVLVYEVAEARVSESVSGAVRR